MTASVAQNRPAVQPKAVAVGAAGFLLMFGVGSMYGLSGLQAALAAQATIGPIAALLPFGATSAGLAVGTGAAGTLLARTGARTTGMLGALLWAGGLVTVGVLIAADLFAATLIAFTIGGFGVGLAYLTIVATVGPAFPTRPLIGSAIGPLGFAAGTAALMILAATGFVDVPTAVIGRMLVIAGAVVAAVSLTAGWGLPTHRTAATVDAPSPGVRSTRWATSLLLFGNAYPGMLVLTIVVPLLTSTSTSSTLSDRSAELAVAAITVALFLGGLTAPRMNRTLGPVRTFTVLLVVRCAALIVATLFPTVPVLLAALALVLFGHGAGFSILPGIVRAQDEPARFARNYALVLISWGIAGVVGCGVAAAAVAAADSFSHALLSAAAVAGLTAVILLVRAPIVLHGGTR